MESRIRHQQNPEICITHVRSMYCTPQRQCTGNQEYYQERVKISLNSRRFVRSGHSSGHLHVIIWSFQMLMLITVASKALDRRRVHC